jgi:hypothetical protein
VLGQSLRWQLTTLIHTIKSMPDLGKTLFFAGLLLATVGAVLWGLGSKGWIGKLPGDISVSKGNFQFYFPLMTCVIVSIVLTLLLWLFRR